VYVRQMPGAFLAILLTGVSYFIEALTLSHAR
jgi:hypothetical protein